MNCIVGRQDYRASLRALGFRRLLGNELSRLESLLGLRIFRRPGVLLLLLHQIVIHLVLHFGSLFGATKAVGLACRTDGVKSL